jgi:tetratricopeptide (TPR) repeat protein
VRYFEAPLPSDDQDYSRAIGLMRSGRGAQAVEAFNKVLANSNYANLRDAAARQLASILEAEKKHAEAAAFLARAAADLSDWIYGPELLLERARVLARSPQRDAAIANWKELAANANRFGSRSRFVQVGAAIGLAESQAASGDHTGAETALNQLLGSLSPSDDAALIGQAQLSLARARIAQKKTVPAIEAYRKAVFMPLDGATRSRAWLELAQLLSDSDAPQALDAAAVAMAIEGVPAEVQTEARQLALRLAGQLGKDAAVAPTLQVEYRDYSSNL